MDLEKFKALLKENKARVKAGTTEQ